MKTAVTLCRVPAFAGGPFVFRDGLAEGFAKSAACGFDAVELHLAGPSAVPADRIRDLGLRHGLAVSAVGTGAGKANHGWTLTDADPARRAAALDFVFGMIGFGAALGAPAILGSMQGRSGDAVSRDQALEWLAEALHAAGRRAAEHGVPFLYEPLSRGESDLLCKAADAVGFLRDHRIANVLLLADLYHMALEERDVAEGVREAGPFLGYVHWADSNRQAMGLGGTDPAPIAAALRELGYDGYLSAEVFPLPDAESAAARSIASLREHLGLP